MYGTGRTLVGAAMLALGMGFTPTGVWDPITRIRCRPERMVKNYGRPRSRYMPHQGDKEIARRKGVRL